MQLATHAWNKMQCDLPMQPEVLQHVYTWLQNVLQVMAAVQATETASKGCFQRHLQVVIGHDVVVRVMHTHPRKNKHVVG